MPRLWHGSAAARLAILAYVAAPPRASAGYVCQVMTQDGSSLQEILQVRCNVTPAYCMCTSSFINGASWLFVSRAVNETMKKVAAPGEWYVMDASGRCVMTLGNQTLLPTPQPCPPGFFCSGGLAPPRSCSSGDHCPLQTAAQNRGCPPGFFCPTPASPLMRCPDGAQCPGRSTSPDGCKAGTYCKDGMMQECPRGSFCPFGSEAPKRCQPFGHCPPGSKSQGVGFNAALLLAVSAGAAGAAARFYGQIVERAWLVFGVCAATVALAFVVDVVIAGFLALLLAVVAANWALLQIGACPPLAAQLLLFVTVSVAILLLGAVNPPWSMLAGGLIFCSFLGWLMSRQNFYVVMTGRVLLVLSFVALLVIYYRIDPGFAVAAASLVLLTCFGLLSSWLCERKRQRQRVALPFLTRWRLSDTLAAFDSPGSFVDAELCGAAPGTALGGAPRAALLTAGVGLSPASSSGVGAADHRPVSAPSRLGGAAPGAAASAAGAPGADGAGGGVGGISFCLEEVNFDLPDGQRLLGQVSLRIASGRRVAVMGPSGSGKSTLLAVLSGRASYGQVTGQLFVSGHPADDLRFLRHVTGFVPQDDVLHGELTVEENVRFQAALRLPEGTTTEQVAAKVAHVAEDLKINGILRSRVGTPERRGVSGGQRKRVSIAMELVSQPLLLFADEPTSGLDSTTSHDVVRCLNGAAARLGTTVIAVIHQPRYETLRLFDDLVLLGAGGCLVYAGGTDGAVEHFRTRLRVAFPADTNPADVLLDAIQPPSAEAFSEAWRAAVPPAGPPPDRARPELFYRQRPPFFRAVLIYMDRSVLQMLRASRSLLVGQGLCIVTTVVLCIMLSYNRLDEFVMQSAFAALFLMLLQGVAAQRIFGADLLTTWREARVGMPMVAYLVAKDLAALFEVSLSAAVFTATYGSQSGAQVELHRLFAGSWAFVYTIFGLNYIFSIVLSPGAAQMSAVVSSFVAFCVAGVYQPQLPQLARMFGGRGWMIPAISPLRWLFGYLLTEEVGHLTEISRNGASGMLKSKGYDMAYLGACRTSALGADANVATLQQAWEEGRGWVCSTAPLLLLGLIFRFLAGLCLMLYVHAQTSGWARFFGQSDAGAWKLAGHLFTLLVGSFLAVFLFAEVWTFGILRLDLGSGGHTFAGLLS